jgi:hypothetical protein
VLKKEGGPGPFIGNASEWEQMRESEDSTDRLFLLDNQARLGLNDFGRLGPLSNGVVLALHAG